MSIDKFHCTNGHCLTECFLSTFDYDRSFPPGFCPHSGIAVYWKKCETTQETPTIFDRITASPEVLAEYMVYSEWVETFDRPLLVYRSTILGSKHFKSYAEAIAATVARLKEVEK